MGYKKRNPTESNSPYEARAKSPFRELDDNNLRLNVNVTKQMTSVLDGNMKIKVNEEDNLESVPEGKQTSDPKEDTNQNAEETH